MPDPMFRQGGKIDLATPIDICLDQGFPLNRHQAAMLFAEPASALVVEDDELADTPPAEADYRPADVEAVACWNCSHFEETGLGDDNWPVGVCHLWESKVQGEAVCDRFTVDRTMRPDRPHQSPTEEADSGEDSVGYSIAEAFLPDGEIEFSESDGLATKTIMRTGELAKTPFSTGVVNKPMKVVRDGASSLKERVISLSELVKNFKAGAYKNVMVPLSGENKDHPKRGSALMKFNTGFVRDLWIEDEGGVSKLRAKIQFTEPEVREKVKNGTYPDVSAGIFFGVTTPEGGQFNSALNHVCLTPRPFMDGLGAFEFADGDQPQAVESLVPAEDVDDYQWDERLSFSQAKEGIEAALHDQLNLDSHYVVKDVAPDRAIIFSEIAEVAWVAPYSVGESGITVSPTTDWHEKAAIEASAEDEQSEEPATAPEATVPSESPLEQARRLRGLRSRGTKQSEGGGVPMGRQAVALDGIDFSDPDKAKEAVSGILEENQRLRSKSQEGEITAKVDRLTEMGFAEMPGFLAAYRDILLSDDGEPVMVLLSHDDSGNETGRDTLTATELADQLISAIPTDKEGKVLLSGQGLDTGTTEPPPAEEEVKPSEDGIDTSKSVEERTAEAEEGLGLKNGDTGKEK